jgi:DNA-binding IclR family transcriptional regulator
LLKSAAERFGATIHVGILEHSMVTYVAKVSARDSVPVPTRCGAQQEPYCSGIGKVLLAGLSDGELECFLGEGELIPLTEQTITDPALFRQEIQRIRRNGFAIDAGEGHPHLSCVAVPVRDPQGETIAALSLMDRRAAMDEQRQDDVRWALSTAAETISRKLRAASSMQTANRVASWRPSPSFTDRLGLASQAQRRRLTA